jgi:hypothetical protein
MVQNANCDGFTEEAFINSWQRIGHVRCLHNFVVFKRGSCNGGRADQGAWRAETRQRLTAVQKLRQGKGGGRGKAEARQRQRQGGGKRWQTVPATGSVIFDRLTKALTFCWPRTDMP